VLFKHQQRWRAFQLTSPSRREAHIAMFHGVLEAFIEKHLFVPPRVFFSKAIERVCKEKKKRKEKKNEKKKKKKKKLVTHILNSKKKNVD
jgi:hypothetical protein